MKTRAAAAAASTQTTGAGAGQRQGRARDKIRDKTNNPPPPPIHSGTSKDNFKKPKRPKQKKPTRKKVKPTPESDSTLLRHAAEASQYLHRWEQNRSEWRFEKLKQIWLLKHLLRRDLISDEYFEVLLNYLTLLKGAAKVQTLNEMRGYMEQYELKYLSVVQRAGVGEPSAEDEGRYERARQVVQILAEEEEEVDEEFLL